MIDMQGQACMGPAYPSQNWPGLAWPGHDWNCPDMTVIARPGLASPCAASMGVGCINDTGPLSRSGHIQEVFALLLVM